jgi:hypothetical protein
MTQFLAMISFMAMKVKTALQRWALAPTLPTSPTRALVIAQRGAQFSG